MQTRQKPSSSSVEGKALACPSAEYIPGSARSREKSRNSVRRPGWGGPPARRSAPARGGIRHNPPRPSCPATRAGFDQPGQQKRGGSGNDCDFPAQGELHGMDYNRGKTYSCFGTLLAKISFKGYDKAQFSPEDWIWNGAIRPNVLAGYYFLSFC